MTISLTPLINLSPQYHKLKCGVWLGHCNMLTNFLFRIVLQICCCAWDHCSLCDTFDSWILWCTEKFMVETMTSRCPGPMAGKQVQITNHPLLEWQLVWGLCADMLCWFFTKLGTVYYGQISALSREMHTFSTTDSHLLVCTTQLSTIQEEEKCCTLK